MMSMQVANIEDDGEDIVHEYTNPAIHQASFKALNTFRLENKFCDFFIKTGFHRYRCHKMVMASTVPFFRKLILPDNQVSEIEEADLTNYNTEYLDIIIEYLYTGTIKITYRNYASLMEMAGFLGIDSLADACLAACREGLLQDESIFGILETSRRFELPGIAVLCYNYINKYVAKLYKFPEFLALEKDIMIEFIKSEVQESTDECVWDAFMAWVKHDEENRKTVITEVLTYARFHSMGMTYLIKHVAEDKLVKNSTAAQDFVSAVIKKRIKAMASDKKAFKEPFVDTNGDFFVLGGGDRIVHRCEVLKYTTSTNKWSTMPSMPYELTVFGAVTLENHVFTIGGCSENLITDMVQKFQVKKRTWCTVSDLNEPRCNLGVCTLGHHIYACGGVNINGSLDSLERYDTRTDTWIELNSMKHKRDGLGMVRLEGSIWAIGGKNIFGLYSAMERYDPREGIWKESSPLIQERYYHGTVVVDNKIYVCGGCGPEANYLDSVEEYDPRNNQWSVRSPMHYARTCHSVVNCNQKIWAVGGYKNDTVEIYDPKKDEWTFGTSLNFKLYNHQAVIIPK